MPPWFEFYAVTGAVAATLLGLLFVAVSINSTGILNPRHANARRLAEQAFQNYLVVMIVSLLALFPQMSARNFFYTVTVLILLRFAWLLYRLYIIVRHGFERPAGFTTLRRHVTALIGFAMMIYAALGSILGYGQNPNLFAAGVMVLLFSSIAVSWELLLKTADLQRVEATDDRP